MMQRLKTYQNDYGDTATGRQWVEEHDIFGYIGRSTGTNKVPLLIPKATSIGGGHILDHCIIKIRESKGKMVLYQHPKFTPLVIEIREGSTLPGYTCETWVNGECYGRHKTLAEAQRLKTRLS